MTQGELRIKIGDIVKQKYYDGKKYDPTWVKETLSVVKLINQHVAEVIGEDEDELQDMERKLYFVGKNDLRTEQRKRARQ